MSVAAPSTRRRALLGDEHQAFRESFARFLADEVVPAHDGWREARTVPAAIYAAAAEHGFVAMQVGEEHGGAGVDDLRFNLVLVEEAMHAGAPGLALGLGAHNDVCVPLLLAHAGAERLTRLAPRLASGEPLTALAAADAPVAGTRAGAGWTLQGRAAFVLNGCAAGVVVTAARTGSEPGDVALFAVDGDAPGLAREASEELIGLQACDLADIRFDGVEVSAEARLGGESAGPDLLRDAAMAQQLSLAVAALAGARAALDETLEYVHDRHAFGQPIARFENTRHALAGIAAEIDVAEAFVDACVRERNAGTLTPARAATAKLRCTELLGDAVDRGVQLHGGYGYMAEYPIARAYADARLLRLLGGSSEAMREVVAHAIGLEAIDVNAR